MEVELVPWSEADLAILEGTNTPEMTEFLGGPEPPEKLLARHQRYLASGDGQMFRIEVEGTAVGSIGFWELQWEGRPVYETGWGVLPEFQGRGIAVAAAVAVIEAARAHGGRSSLHAFPKVGHAASNAVCRKAGFTFVGEVEFEYPKGVPIRCNDWRVDLSAAR